MSPGPQDWKVDEGSGAGLSISEEDSDVMHGLTTLTFQAVSYIDMKKRPWSMSFERPI